MCGIAGVIRRDGATDADRATLQRMVSALKHRGPDDEGMWVNGSSAIGMRRLAIIDLQSGHQPMSNEDGSIWIVFNGEIYNHKDLRAKLEAGGRHRFRTQSDTEVLLHLYEDMGRGLPALLEGMFAFCIVDTRAETAFFARDRFGEKPLFYSAHDNLFAFSSEIASLLEAPWISRQANLQALHEYLQDGAIGAPATAFRDVSELQPGHWLEVSKNSILCRPVERVPEAPKAMFRDPIEAAQAVRTTICAAVGRQMISDVPIGAFLSGGIDSSTIVAAMQLQSARPVRTFTARFEHAPYDESPIARAVASHLGTDHTEIVIHNEAFRKEDLTRIVRHVGQPFSDSSAIPTYFVCREISRHVKVCLSGDGGDEMFAGYSLFRWLLRIDSIAALLPPNVSRAGATLLRHLAILPGLDRLSPMRRAWRALDAAGVAASKRLSHISQMFDDQELFDASPRLAGTRAVAPDRELPASHASRPSRLRELMQQRISGSLQADMLVKVDRMSMAASLEVRAPMLDASVATLAERLPDAMLIKDGVGKAILREAVKDWLPETVFSHPKTGFSIPLHMFQNAEYSAVCQDLLLSDRVPLMRSMFDRVGMAAIVQRGLSQKRDTGQRSTYRSSHQLWALLNLAAWADDFRVFV